MTLCISDTVFTEGRPAEDFPVQNLLSGLNCSGLEERLADCDHDGVNIATTGCSRAYVECKAEGMNQNSECTVVVIYAGER